MRGIIQFIRREPAMLVALVLAIVNAFVELNAGQADAIRSIAEATIILLGGTVIRQAVTPTVKLRDAQ